jgi:hypothetical protein
MKGGNVHDIKQEIGVKLITKLYFERKPNDEFPDKEKTIIVGDIHGDLHQLLAPLVINNIIKLTGEVVELKYNDMNDELEQEFDESSVWMPVFDVVSNNKVKLILLGDIVDEWIFSRTILVLLCNLMDKINIEIIIGNHDIAIISRYELFRQGMLNVFFDIPILWNTIKKELKPYKRIHVYGNIIEYDGNTELGNKFLIEYMQVYFNCLYKIFQHDCAKIGTTIKLKNNMFIVSHTTWTLKSLLELINEVNDGASRPNDSNEIQKYPILPETRDNDEVKKIKTTNVSNENLSKFVVLVNKIFKGSTRLYCSKNKLVSGRGNRGIIFNTICGHTIGGAARDIGVNVEFSELENERKKHLNPETIEGKSIYYFDFGASAGYNHDEISRPDFITICDDKINISNLNSFTFETINEKHALVMYNGKTQRNSREHIIL